MRRRDLERLSKDESIESELQRSVRSPYTSSKPLSTDRKERREQSRPGRAKPGHEGHSPVGRPTSSLGGAVPGAHSDESLTQKFRCARVDHVIQTFRSSGQGLRCSRDPAPLGSHAVHVRLGPHATHPGLRLRASHPGVHPRTGSQALSLLDTIIATPPVSEFDVTRLVDQCALFYDNAISKNSICHRSSVLTGVRARCGACR